MRVLFFDAFSGVSGDMTVAAAIALGVDPVALEERLRLLPIGGYRLRVGERSVNGIRARTFDVEIEHRPHHEHRTFRDLRVMIETSPLEGAVKARAVDVFTRLAEAEGRVHGNAPEDVTFHEVGAIDSIVDVVATAIALDDLAVEHGYVSPLPLGSGAVSSSHGTLPVPAPATVEILRGFPVRPGDGTAELVTPTGAAIVASLARPGEPAPSLAVERIGYGAGTWTLPDRPNVLRLLLATTAAAPRREEMVIVETNVDDASPEIYEYVMERLFEAGARDVWLAPVVMKKGRPAVVLRALGESAARDLLASIILRETTAIGVRTYPVERLVLPRERITVSTEYGPIDVKRSQAPDGSLNLAPEYESCKCAARETGAPLKAVYEAALAAARESIGR